LPEALVWPGLVLLGLAVGVYGTIVGAGGGFVLAPVLLLLYPDDPPELITSISIGAVFFNALSGTAAYARQRRIDFIAAGAFAAATVPGAIAGSLLTGALPREVFEGIFAVVLLLLSALLVLRPEPRVVGRTTRRGEISRLLTDSRGDTYFYSYDIRLGVGISVVVGFLAALLGIGGGPIHVPLLVQLLHFPAHIATATSQAALVVTAGTSALVHLLSGDYAGGYIRTAALAVGVVAGAQAGARLSLRLRGRSIVRLMAAGLAVLGLRLLAGAVV
jgi:uncharacterized membrane protein YfcA